MVFSHAAFPDLMKSIVSVFASSTEENFKNEGRPEKWTDLAEVTKKSREKRIAGKGKKVKIPARPYLQLTDDDFEEILSECKMYLSDNG